MHLPSCFPRKWNFLSKTKQSGKQNQIWSINLGNAPPSGWSLTHFLIAPVQTGDLRLFLFTLHINHVYCQLRKLIKKLDFLLPFSCGGGRGRGKEVSQQNNSGWKKIPLIWVWPSPCTRKDAVNFFKTGQQNEGSGSLSACIWDPCAFEGRLGYMSYTPLCTEIINWEEWDEVICSFALPVPVSYVHMHPPVGKKNLSKANFLFPQS